LRKNLFFGRPNLHHFTDTSPVLKPQWDDAPFPTPGGRADRRQRGCRLNRWAKWDARRAITEREHRSLLIFLPPLDKLETDD
jgi:hypothetical protein